MKAFVRGLFGKFVEFCCNSRTDWHCFFSTFFQMKAIAALLLCVVIIEVAEGWRSRPRSDAPRWCKSYDCPVFTVLERTRVGL